MEAYTGFAQVYDRFMDNIDYDGWCAYLIELLKKYDIDKVQGNAYGNKIILDMGCGTGNVTMRLASEGYDMIGIDNSYDMLNIAMDKRGGCESILYLHQDMRSFELYGTVAAVVCICDSINYITEYEDLVQVFSLVNNYLDPGGVFIFDLKTQSNFLNIGDAMIAEDREECSFIWDNYYDADERINEYQLSLFVKGADGRYDKYTEEHYQRAYSMEEIKQALREAGLEYVTALEAFTQNPATEKQERIYVIAREHGKERQAEMEE